MANANKPSQGSSTQRGMNEGMNAPGRDMGSQSGRGTQGGQSSNKGVNQKSSKTGQQGNKNK